MKDIFISLYSFTVMRYTYVWVLYITLQYRYFNQKSNYLVYYKIVWYIQTFEKSIQSIFIVYMDDIWIKSYRYPSLNNTCMCVKVETISLSSNENGSGCWRRAPSRGTTTRNSYSCTDAQWLTKTFKTSINQIHNFKNQTLNKSNQTNKNQCSTVTIYSIIHHTVRWT